MSELKKATPIEFPPDEVMLSLLAVALAAHGSVDTGELVAHIPSRRGETDRVVPCEHVDALVGCGWVAYVGALDLDPTRKGVYWLNRWLAPRGKRLFGARTAD